MHRLQLFRNLFSVTFTLLIGSLTSLTFGQQQLLDPKQGGYWIAYVGDNKLNKHLGIHSEIQLRNFFVKENVETLLLRTGVNIYIKPYAMATAGYGYIYSKPSQDYLHASEVSEHRTWQQLVLRQNSKLVMMEHRYRLEQRFLENLTTGNSKIDHRIRYRFQTQFFLKPIANNLRNFFVVLNDEIMLNFRSTPTQLFDRNRFFAGFGYQVNPKLNFQLGYMNQFAQVSWKSDAQIDHLLQFSIVYNTDVLQRLFSNKSDS